MGVLGRLILCLAVLGTLLFSFIEGQNTLIEMRLRLPALEKRLHELEEGNNNLQYEVDSFESPAHLFELQAQPAFSHLRHPITSDVIIIETGGGREN